MQPLLGVGVLLLLAAQILLGWHLRPYRPAIEQMPIPPSPLALKVLALGDDEFLYRAEVSWLQEVGDGGGRVKPLKEFDYQRVAGWLAAVDTLDPRSDAVFQLGSTYFGAISDPGSAPLKLPPLIEYFASGAMVDPSLRWHWLVWSAIKVQHVVKSQPLADALAEDLLSLRQNEAVPAWLPLLAAPMLRSAGEAERAAALDADPDMIARRLTAQRAFEGKRPHGQMSKPEQH